MFARFDENPAMTLQDIKETKCYGRMHAPRTTNKVKTVYPPVTKLAGGIKNIHNFMLKDFVYLDLCSSLKYFFLSKAAMPQTTDSFSSA